MANVKITALTNLGSADIDAADVFVIDDVSATETKKVTVANLQAAIDTIATSNINTVSANVDAAEVRLNANIDIVQDNVASLSTILRVAGDSGADDVTVGTDDLTFTGGSNVSTAVTDNTVTISVDFSTTETNIDAVETRRADNVFFTYNSTGDQANVIINAANVEPSQNNIFSLGAPDRVWKDVYVGPGSINLGNVTLSAVETGLKIEDAQGATTQLDTTVANVAANLNLIQDNVAQVSQDVSDLESRRADNVTIRINAFTGTNAAIVATESRINSNLDVTNDNVATLTTTVDNFGTSSNANAAALAADIASLSTVDTATGTETRLNANLDLTNDNVTTLTTTVDNFGTSSNANATALAAEDAALQVRISDNAAVAASNDYVTYTRLDANISVVQDNVTTLTTTVDNFGTSSNANAAALASGIVASEVRVNANLDLTNDNVANITDGTTPFSAPVTFTDNVTISGSLIVTGAQVDLGVQSATVDNNFIELSAELSPGDVPATDSGLLINRGNKGNVFIGDHLGEDGVIFVRTQSPDTNTTVAIESFMDVHANMFHAAGPTDLGRVHFGLRDAEDTGIIVDDAGANINFVADGSYVANVHFDGTLNSQNAIIAPAIFSDGVELQANDSATLFSARANDFATYTHITANVDIVQDNVSTLTTTVDNHGTYANSTFSTVSNAQSLASDIATNESTRSSNASALAAGIATKLDSSDYTASDVLTKIKTVDGAGSGLDADLLDGQSSAYYAVEATRSSNAAALAAGIAGITPIGTSDISDNAVTVDKLAATLDLGAL